MIIIKCQGCKKACTPNPEYKYFKELSSDPDILEKNYWCSQCYADQGQTVNWFILLDPYLQKQSIEAWK